MSDVNDESKFVPDYGPLEGEIPDEQSRIRSSTSKPNKGRRCPSCPGRFTNVRRHVLRCHVPWYVSPTTACWQCKLQFGQECLLDGHIAEFHNSVSEGRKFMEKEHDIVWVELINGFLDNICNKLGCKTLLELCEFANSNIQFEPHAEPVFQEVDKRLLSVFNTKNNYEIQNNSYTVASPFEICTLLHWKVLSSLIQKTDDSENMVSFEQRKSRKTLQVANLVDSHFHLDMYSKKSKNNVLPSLSWKWGEVQYQVQYAVANYCFPRNWPISSERSTIREDQRIRITFGIHPRLISIENRRLLDKWCKKLEELLDATSVVAVGECGLDTSTLQTDRDMRIQLEYFEKQVKLAKLKNLPVVIHCRGNDRTDEICLNLLSKWLPSIHRIHRHCFNGKIFHYKRWKSAFSNCKFGISPFLLNSDKYPDFRSLVCEMDLQDLVLETDAPYIYPCSYEFGTPILVGDIAEKLANIFSCTVDTVAEITTRNAVELYGIRPTH